MTSPVRRFLAIFLICLLPLQSMLALAAPACSALPDAQEHHMHPGLDTAEELAAHALSHRLGAHHHAHLDGAVSPASGTEPMAHADGATPCSHGGVHSHADTGQGSDADQADCDSALHCMGSHLVSLLPGCVVRSVAPDVRNLPAPHASAAFRSALTEPLHRPPIHAA